MVTDLDDALNILGGNDGSLPRSFIGDHAAQVHDAVADDNAEADGAPVVLFNLVDDPPVDLVVIGRRIRHIAGEVGPDRRHIAISGSGIRSRFGSGISVIVASVNSRTLATDTAFSSAVRTTLAGSTMPASTRST